MIDPLNDLNELVRRGVEQAFGPRDPALEISVRRSEHADHDAFCASNGPWLVVRRKVRVTRSASGAPATRAQACQPKPRGRRNS